MNCKTVRHLLMAYLDDEVADADRESIEQHMKGCPDCQKEVIALEHMRKQLSYVLDLATDTPAQPEETWARIRKQIRSEEQESRYFLTPAGSDSTLIQLSRRLRMLLLKQPRWKIATIGTALLAIAVTLSLVIPSFGGEQDMALAASQLAQNSQEVKDACGGDGEVEIIDVSTYDGRGYVLCTTNMGQVINADVDLNDMKVASVEAMLLPGLSNEEQEKAVNIAKADPTIQNLLNEGATINSVIPVYGFDSIDSSTVQQWIPELELMTVEVYHADGHKVTFVEIDLNEECVKSIREAEVIQESGPIIGADGHDLNDICITTVTDMTDAAPVVTEEQRQDAINIARTDPSTKHYFDQGAVITNTWGFHERNLVFLRESTDSDPIISVQRYPLVGLRLELADAVWHLKIDLSTQVVVTMDRASHTIVQRHVEVIGDDDCAALLGPGELMDIAVSDPDVHRLLIGENGMIGVPISCIVMESTTGETRELMQVPIEVGQDTWMMEIDLNAKLVTQLTKAPPRELIQGEIPVPEVDLLPR